ncbi:MAG: hypothetical protein HYZ72_01690 [Deltaproteobacteria bacterium]|nr:hypothetical protein [Deltaproteobacteria bacterium]
MGRSEANCPAVILRSTVAVAAVVLAKKLRWPPLTALVQRALIAAQRLEQTCWRSYTGSFVAAKAVRKV